jgi:hypothetical protein
MDTNMENKRTRKFTYIYEKWDDNLITNLKLMESKYHIFGIDDNQFLKGYIFFTNPKTILKIKKQFYNCKIDDTEFTIDSYKKLDNNWENGVLPIQGRPKKNPMKAISNELVPVTNSIIEQNTSLIEQSKEICQYLMKQNQQLLEENKQLKQTTTATTMITNNIEKLENTTNIDNKTFNINLFLNEDCKNAITLGEFINSLKIEDSDLFCAKEHGLVEAITNIFQRGLENCDVNTRPVHCTDTKRETLHIKDDDGWVRESGSDSKRMKNAITRISNNKIKKLSEYIKEHPEFNNVKSPKYEDCLQMMRNVMGASEDSDKTEKRVLKNIAKSVYIAGNPVI